MSLVGHLLALSFGQSPRLNALTMAGTLLFGLSGILVQGQPVFSIALTGIAILDLCTQLRAKSPRPVWLSKVVGAALAGSAILLNTAWFSTQTGTADQAWLDNMVDIPWIAAPNKVAITDQGTPLPLHTPEREDWVPDVIRRHDPTGQFATKKLAECDPRSNCHGWVFADGAYLIRGESVPTILSENGYERVSEPRLGDVVVCFGPAHTVEHTGLVHHLAEEGTVFVESKWGTAGRYLHPVMEQPYGRHVEYYRSPRHGNMLAIKAVDGATPDTVAQRPGNKPIVQSGVLGTGSASIRVGR